MYHAKAYGILKAMEIVVLETNNSNVVICTDWYSVLQSILKTHNQEYVIQKIQEQIFKLRTTYNIQVVFRMQ